MSKLVERLRREGENAMRQHLSLGMHKLCTEAADEIERLTAELADARVTICAFAGPAAAEYSKAFGLDGLHPHHYDILEKAGARMDDFKRAVIPNPVLKGE